MSKSKKDLAFETEGTVASAPVAAVEMDINADALTPGIECPFTDGCRGKVHVFNYVTRQTQGDNDQPRTERFQQLKCNKCNRIASGVKRIGGDAGNSKLFNRVTAKSE